MSRGYSLPADMNGSLGDLRIIAPLYLGSILSTVQLENGDDQIGLSDAHPDDPSDGLGRIFGNAAFDALFNALSGFCNTGVETRNGFCRTGIEAFNIVVRRQVDSGLPVMRAPCRYRR
jgi:hypothetical protein